jgi:hypothetical protein
MRTGAALAVFALLGACAPQANRTAPASPAPSRSPAATRAAQTAPPVTFRGERVGSHYVYATKQNGTQKVYVLRADSVNAVYEGVSTGRSNFVNPHVVMYGRAGKRLTADAPAGSVVEKDKTVVMRGGVRARSEDGMRLACDTLRYEDQTQRVHGVGHVVVTFPQGERLAGETLDWSLRDGHISVTGGR